MAFVRVERLVPNQEEEGEGSWTGPVDGDGFPVGRVPDEKKKIEALPPVDHSQIEVCVCSARFFIFYYVLAFFFCYFRGRGGAGRAGIYVGV